ncbi:hypothetical protein J1N35_025470, partial [Gossypium stocksii]
FDISNQGITGGQYHVHLRNRTCDYGSFDALRYRCAHAIVACQNLCLDPMSYVDDVYKIEYICYRIENCVANQRVDLAQVEYATIWISEKQPTNKNYVDGVGTQAIQVDHVPIGMADSCCKI